MTTGGDPARASGAAGELPVDAAREKRVVALTSVAAAVLLTAGKLVVGFTTGSLGILAEAAHSGLDLVAAIITYFAVRVSDKPADAEHLYGHGKVENLSALAETALLLATCGWIFYEGIERLFFKDVQVEATFWAFGVIVVSIVVDVSRSRALARVARKYNSQALEADALHFSTDIWSSAVVLLGLALVRLSAAVGGAAWLRRADAVAALVVALIVVYVSVRLGRRTADALLDRAPRGLRAKVEEVVRGVGGVLECRQVRLRSAGAQSFVDLTVGVRRSQSAESGHAIAAAVEEQIKAVLPSADVVVHIEPLSDAHETLAERIRAIAASAGRPAHNILVAEDAGRVRVELHLEVDERLDLRQAHEEAHRLEGMILAELPQITQMTTHIEPHQDERTIHGDVTEFSTDLVQRVQQLAAATPGIVDCHDVTARHSGAGVSLTMHCTFAPGLSVRRVHEISSELEQHLRAAIPNLARVTTHPEPVEGGQKAVESVPPE